MKKLLLCVLFLSCSSTQDSTYPVSVNRQLDNNSGCLTKSRARRLIIRTIPDTSYVNATIGVIVFPAVDSVNIKAELYDPVNNETWTGTSCQVLVQYLDIGVFRTVGMPEFWFITNYDNRTYRIEMSVMTQNSNGTPNELFARDTAVIISPRL